MLTRYSDEERRNLMLNPLALSLAMAQSALAAWMPMMSNDYWRGFFSGPSHPDHQEFEEHAQLEVPDPVEDDGERNLFA